MAIYYVKNGGNDSSDGLSDGNAWLRPPGMKYAAGTSLATTLAANDVVLFNKGDTWTDRWIPGDSGTSGNVITYGAYGAGGNPIFNRVKDVNGWTSSGNWTEVETNKWRITETGDSDMRSERSKLDGVEALRAENLAGLTASYRQFGTGTYWYVFSSGNPAITFSTITCSSNESNNSPYCVYLDGPDYVTFENLEFIGGAFSIWIKASCNNITFNYCTMGEFSRYGINASGGNTIILNYCTIDSVFTGTFNYANACMAFAGISLISEGDNMTGWEINNCTIVDWMHACIDVEAANLDTVSLIVTRNDISTPSLNYGRAVNLLAWAGGTLSNTEVTYNNIHDCATRSQFNGTGTEIHHNIFMDGVRNNCGIDWSTTEYNKTQALNILSYASHADADACEIYNNVFVRFAEEGLLMEGDGGIVNCKIRNNIFYDCGNDPYSNSPVSIWVEPQAAINTNTITHNKIYQDADLDTVYYRGAGYRTITEFNAGASDSDTINNNTQEDPEMVAPASGDFHLLSDSPCIGAGINVGLSLDYDGVSIGDPPDIGIYEYVLYFQAAWMQLNNQIL